MTDYILRACRPLLPSNTNILTNTYMILEHAAQLWRFSAMSWHMLLVFDKHVFVLDSVLVFMFEKPDQTRPFKISRM